VLRRQKEHRVPCSRDGHVEQPSFLGVLKSFLLGEYQLNKGIIFDLGRKSVHPH
jgi:hypothetical protein